MTRDKEGSFYVYCLVNPETRLPFYIGRTKRDPSTRLKEHVSYVEDDRKGALVRYLKNEGIDPFLVVLEERFGTSSEATISELFWVELLRSRGIKLLNAALFIDGQSLRLDESRHDERYPFEAHPNSKSAEIGLAKGNNRPPKCELKRSNRGLPWTIEEDRLVSSEFRSGLPVDAIAEKHERSIGGVTSRLSKLGLFPTLRQTEQADPADSLTPLRSAEKATER